MCILVVLNVALSYRESERKRAKTKALHAHKRHTRIHHNNRLYIANNKLFTNSIKSNSFVFFHRDCLICVGTSFSLYGLPGIWIVIFSFLLVLLLFSPVVLLFSCLFLSFARCESKMTAWIAIHVEFMVNFLRLAKASAPPLPRSSLLLFE